MKFLSVPFLKPVSQNCQTETRLSIKYDLNCLVSSTQLGSVHLDEQIFQEFSIVFFAFPVLIQYKFEFFVPWLIWKKFLMPSAFRCRTRFVLF